MSENYKKLILTKLIAWYEDSPAHARNQKPDRRRIMRLHDKGKTDFKAYNIEDPVIRKEINQAVLDLADKNFIGYQWMRGQENHILSGLWLNFDTLEQVYSYIGQKPKGDIVDGILLQLKGYDTLIPLRLDFCPL